MSGATKADLRRACIRTAALTHWKHNGGRIGIPSNSNSAPPQPGAESRAGVSTLQSCARPAPLNNRLHDIQIAGAGESFHREDGACLNNTQVRP